MTEIDSLALFFLPAFATYVVCSLAGWHLAGEQPTAGRAQVRFSLIWLATVLPLIGLAGSL